MVWKTVRFITGFLAAAFIISAFVMLLWIRGKPAFEYILNILNLIKWGIAFGAVYLIFVVKQLTDEIELKARRKYERLLQRAINALKENRDNDINNIHF